jgi:hypothetical protein
MEERSTLLGEASTEYVDRWNRLISTTNWEKGRIISEWRDALQQAGVPAATYTDDAWSREVGGVTPQHVGRLRRVYDRFGSVFGDYAGLFWSHFQAAREWSDAEMYLEGAVQNRWSVAQMRNQRWEALGGPPEQKPSEADIVVTELDEDVSAAHDESPSATISESVADVHGEDEAFDGEPLDEAEAAAVPDRAAPVADEPEVERVRPFEDLPPLPADLNEAFELMKLAILSHKVSGWQEIARDDVLAALDSLRQLALAPAE